MIWKKIYFVYKNKLIHVLAGFSRKEMTRFKEFCYSPYFNKHEQVQRLVGYLSDIYPKFDEKRCNRQFLYGKLFDREDFDQGKLALVFTYTQKCLEQFLAQEQYQNDEASQKIFLLKSLIQYEEFFTFEKILKKLEKEHLSKSVRNANYYHHTYLLAKNADDYYNLIDRRRVDNSLEEKQENLNFFFILEKLKDACETKVRQNILKVNYQDRMTELVLREIEEQEANYEAYPAITFYFQLYKMLDKQEDTSAYFQALGSLENRTHLFPRKELIHIYIYFMNYCISRINKGDSKFLNEVFKLYKAQLTQELLYENGQLSEWDYKNIVTTAIRLHELDWVYEFIETYKERLKPEARENAYQYNLAAYHYANGSLAEVLNLLTRVEYSDLRYNLSAKALLLRTYYDLNEFEPLLALTESFRQYLMRNKLMSDNRRTGFNNLFKVTRKLSALRNKVGFTGKEKLYKDLEKIDHEINETKLLYNRDWLIEKWEDLRNKIG